MLWGGKQPQGIICRTNGGRGNCKTSAEKKGCAREGPGKKGEFEKEGPHVPRGNGPSLALKKATSRNHREEGEEKSRR